MLLLRFFFLPMRYGFGLGVSHTAADVKAERNKGDYAMAIYYVAHRYGGDRENLERAKKITHDLQLDDPTNCYVCPLLAFSHLKYNEMSYEEEMALCLDLLSVSDALVIASDINGSRGVQEELDFARMVDMEVIDLADKYREV